jgi:phage/plasmid-like protein (TIGR03299 family)
MDALVDSGEAMYDTAGPLRGGRWVFMAVKFPKEIKIGGEDPIDLFGVLWNSHDGSKAITMMVTPVRPICENTLQLGLAKAKTSFSIRHTTSLEGRLAEAREALKLTYQAADVWEEEMNRLAEKKFTDAKFEALVQQLTDKEPVRKGLLDTWATSESVDRATAYGAFNAVTEYVDWTRQPRGANARMMSSLFGQGMRLRNDAFRTLQAA